MKFDKLKEMQDYIYARQSVSLKELSATFHISMNTVRRYINELTASTNIKKIYGGVCVNTDSPKPYSFDERAGTSTAVKQIIGKTAARFIQERDTIFIDSGTTTKFITEYLPDNMELTIVTNNLYTINSIIDKPNITCITLAGILERRTLSFGGEIAARQLENYNINKAFMACTGLSIQNGATNLSYAEYYVKQIAVKKAAHVYLLADSSKFTSSTLMTYAPLSSIDSLITNEAPDDEFKTYCQNNQIEIILASP